jgi:hypothetical protein
MAFFESTLRFKANAEITDMQAPPGRSAKESDRGRKGYLGKRLTQRRVSRKGAKEERKGRKAKRPPLSPP